VVSESHVQRLREELTRAVGTPAAPWEAWAARGWCQAVRGDLAAAVADLGEAVRRRPTEPGLFSLLALIHLTAGRREEARHWLDRLAACPGVDMHAWHAWQAHAREEEAAWDLACWHLDRLLEKGKQGIAKLYYRRGRAYSKLGQHDKAKADFARAAELGSLQE
jgi:tetratricopeptide (TPR) repeat protein